jgi:voltage-gated potassium channel
MLSRKRVHRNIRANLEYFRILILEFKGTLLLIGAIPILGSLLFHFFYVDPNTQGRPDYVESLYRTFVLMSMNFPETFPRHPVLRLWCFTVPFISLVVVSEAVVRLAVLLTSKATSGRRWSKAMVAAYDDHIILCGLGRLGYSILLELVKMGKEVAIVELHETAYGVSEARRRNIPVVIEDARNAQVLADLGIHKAQAVVAATDNDMANLEIALDARTLRPGIRVVVRMFDQQIAQKIARSFDIRLIFSASAIAAPSFAAATVDRTLVNSFYIDDKQLQTVKLLIGPGSPLVGKPLGFLREHGQLSILSHRRHNQEAVLFPPDGTILQENDKVAVLAQAFVIGRLHELNPSVKAAV